MINPLTTIFNSNTYLRSREAQQVDSKKLDATTTSVVITFFKNNYSILITTFLAYCVILGAATGLKGKSLLALSASSAVWTIVKGKAAFGLVASAPAVFALASIFFNWASKSNNEQPQQPDTRLPTPTPQKPVRKSSEEQKKGFDKAWSNATIKEGINSELTPKAESDLENVWKKPVGAKKVVSPQQNPISEAAWKEAKKIVGAEGIIRALTKIATNDQKKKFPKTKREFIGIILSNMGLFFRYLGLTDEQGEQLTLLRKLPTANL